MTEPRPITVDYYAHRAAQERAAAEKTQDTTVRRVHLELAERYEALLAPQPAAL